MQNTKLGQFSISIDVIENQPELAKEILSQTIVIRAECLYGKKAIQYLAICDEFEPLDIAEDAPYYSIVLEDIGKLTRFKSFQKHS